MVHRWHGLGMASLGIAYFAFYVPYSALANTLARGLLPGVGRPASGLELLPAAALGTVAGMVLFLVLSGWWRHVLRRPVPGASLPVLSREILLAAFFHALIIGATTLSYTFDGVSILFVLLLMRGGILILSPLIDSLRRRDVQRSSWVALGLSLAAVTLALADVDHYSLSLGAALSLSTYFAGYLGRFQIMERVAKSQGFEANRRYYLGEQMLSSPVLLAGLGAAALLAPGGGGESLRRGFTTFLGSSEAALPAFLVGVLYAGLSAFGSLIYVDRREYTYCVPVNRGASLMSGVVASYGLTLLFGLRPPTFLQLTGAGLVLIALAVLATGGSRRLFLFVCSGNTCRSPMAEAIGRAELAARFGERVPVRLLSAGLAVRPGAPMTSAAAVALREIGAPPGRHRARPLTPDLVERAEAVFCMTAEQREAVLRLVPDAEGKVWCLDPGGDILDPIGSAPEIYREYAVRLRGLVRRRFDEMLAEA
jgi:protein-tyrosine-phosphatase